MKLHNYINKENLKIFVTSFYKKTLTHEELGHFFIQELGEDITSEEWVEHIDLLVEFWLVQFFGEGDYGGNFIGMHVKVPHIQRESFTHWMELFNQTTNEVYTPDIAELFKEKGTLLSEQFMHELNV